MAEKQFTAEQKQALVACAELAGMKAGVSVTTRAIAEKLGWTDARVDRVMTELEALDSVGSGKVN